MIPRKWEWIQDQCARRSLKDAAKLAGEIDTVLLDCYDVKHTREWVVFCERNKIDELADEDRFFFVVKSFMFCVACRACSVYCPECSFGKECGDCNNPNSLFGRFYTEAVKGLQYKLIITDGDMEE